MSASRKLLECLDGENIIICNEDGTVFTDAKCDPFLYSHAVTVRVTVTVQQERSINYDG